VVRESEINSDAFGYVRGNNHSWGETMSYQSWDDLTEVSTEIGQEV